MFYNDPTLDALAVDKAAAGCRRQLKRVAQHYTTCGNQRRFIQAYKAAYEFGHLTNEYNITIVCIQQGILFFHTTPDEVRNLINSLVPVVKSKVPPTVIVKMIADRLIKIVSGVKKMNKRAWDHYKWAQSNPAYGRSKTPPVDVPLPEVRTIEEARALSSINDWEVQRVVKDMEKRVFSKPEVTDDDVSRAMDLVVVSIVTEE